MQGRNRFIGWTLFGAAVCFWTSWALMPGVGVTDASRILSLVGAQPQRVLLSSVLQLLSAALLGMAIPGLALRLGASKYLWGRAAVTLLAVGACGDAADAIYHQLAYEMVRPGIDQAAMLPVMQRMQSADLLYLLPMIAAFLFGCVALSIAATRLGVVSKWNPSLYVLSVIIAVAANGLHLAPGVSGRAVGLICLGLLSLSLAWIGLALGRSGDADMPGISMGASLGP
ncbi:MAG: hypothetical protein C5B51_13190 [Terriglobia bacterium]|nr:MAG: hypothetical protein C5B51_13190 [Terriglobia bacterium]